MPGVDRQRASGTKTKPGTEPEYERLAQISVAHLIILVVFATLLESLPVGEDELAVDDRVMRARRFFFRGVRERRGPGTAGCGYT